MSGGRRLKLGYAVAEDGRFAFNGSQGVGGEFSAGKQTSGFRGGVSRVADACNYNSQELKGIVVAVARMQEGFCVTSRSARIGIEGLSQAWGWCRFR